MNGRTAQGSRIPVNGTAAAGNSHGLQPEPHLDQVAPDEEGVSQAPDPEAAEQPADTDQPPAEPTDEPADADQSTDAGQPEDDQAETATPAWVAEYAARIENRAASGTAGNGTTYAEFETPIRVDEIAVAAKELSENLQAATRGMPESVELRALRRDLDQAANTFLSIAGELEATAGSLIRLAANEGRHCGVGWGVCPEHGLTLMNVGETVTCHVLGCHRENEGAVERCDQPVAYRVVDAAGPALLTCTGHAIACRLYLENPVITLASDSFELF